MAGGTVEAVPVVFDGTIVNAEVDDGTVGCCGVSAAGDLPGTEGGAACATSVVDDGTKRIGTLCVDAVAWS